MTDESAATIPRVNRILKALGPLASLALFALAAGVLHHFLREHSYREILAQVRAMPMATIGLGAILTLASYLALCGYDMLALRFVGHSLPYGRTALASFVSYAFSHNLGMTLLSSGSARFRLYSAWGVSATRITLIVLFCNVSFWVGFFSVGGLVLLVQPLPIPPLGWMPFSDTRSLGILALSVTGLLLTFSAVGPRTFRIHNWSVPLPSLRMLLAQIGVSSVDWMLAASVLFVLLPAELGLTYPHVLALFFVAQVVAMASNVPGGIGVFEGIVLFFNPGADPATLMGCLVVYRVVYYLLPLGTAIVLLGVHEAVRNRPRAPRLLVRPFDPWAAQLVTSTLFCGVLLCGALVLFSGATPGPARMPAPASALPVPLVELAHVLASVAGLLLLLLARGLQRRSHTAWRACLIVLPATALLCVIRGQESGSAAALMLVLVGLVPASRRFYRSSARIDEPLDPGWVAAMLLVLTGSIALTSFSYPELRSFANVAAVLTGSSPASSSLRGLAAASALAIGYLLVRLLDRRQSPPLYAAHADPLLVRDLTARSGCMPLALDRDRWLLFAADKRAMLSFSRRRRTWLGWGDPVGSIEAWPDLVWRFRDLSERRGARPALFGVSAGQLALYRDLGLADLEIGSELMVKAQADADRSPVPGTEEQELEVIESQDESGAVRTAHATLVRDRVTVVSASLLLIHRTVHLRSVTTYPEQAPWSSASLLAHLSHWAGDRGLAWISLGLEPRSLPRDHPLFAAFEPLARELRRAGPLPQTAVQAVPVLREPRFLVRASGLDFARVLSDVTALLAESRTPEPNARKPLDP